MFPRFHIGRVIEPHVPAQTPPLKLRAGELVTVGEEVPHQPGWVECTDSQGRTGRVPKDWLVIHEDAGTLRQDYNSAELPIRHGKVIIIGEESGWVWCMNREKQYGWLPRRKVKLVE